MSNPTILTFLSLLLGSVGLYIFLSGVWLFYLGIMSLQRARDADKLTRPAYLLGLPLLWTGLTLDFLCNILVCTVLFGELPREWLVTSRLQRLAQGPDGRRKRMALWFAANLLDSFDPKGYHVLKPVEQALRSLPERSELMPQLDKAEQKAAIKEAIQEWMNEQFAAFGRWTFYGLLAAAFAGAVYLAAAGKGLVK